MIDRITAPRLEVKDWKLSTNPDLRYEGGTLCVDGEPIMPHMWPTFDQIASAIKVPLGQRISTVPTKIVRPETVQSPRCACVLGNGIPGGRTAPAPLRGVC